MRIVGDVLGADVIGAYLHGSAVLDPVPTVDLRRAIVGGVTSLIADLEPDTQNVVLTLARIRVTLATGEIVAKDVAADWALARLPAEHRPVLARARDGYRSGVYADFADLAPRVRPHAAHVAARPRRPARTAQPTASVAPNPTQTGIARRPAIDAGAASWTSVSGGSSTIPPSPPS